MRWQLRSDAIDEVVREVEKLQAGTSAEASRPTGSLEPDLIDASLTMAADSILRASGEAPTSAMPLVDSARSSLLAAGFDPSLNEFTIQGGAEEHENAPRARLINSVSDLVEAELIGDHERIDLAKAKALPLVRAARTSTFAEEWLPLAEHVVNAEGSVLGGSVEVVYLGGQSLVQKLFPHLTRVSAGSRDFGPGEESGLPASVDVLADDRVALEGTLSRTLPTVIFHILGGHSTGAVISGLLRNPSHRPEANIRLLPKRVVLAEDLDPTNIATITGGNAQLLVFGQDTHNMQKGLARVVNRTVVGLDAGRSGEILFIKH